MDLRGLAELAGEMAARSRPDTPDSDPDGEFDDRSVRLETTFGGAGVMSGDLTPECAAVVIEVLGPVRPGRRGGHPDLRPALPRCAA